MNSIRKHALVILVIGESVMPDEIFRNYIVYQIIKIFKLLPRNEDCLSVIGLTFLLLIQMENFELVWQCFLR